MNTISVKIAYNFQSSSAEEEECKEGKHEIERRKQQINRKLLSDN